MPRYRSAGGVRKIRIVRESEETSTGDAKPGDRIVAELQIAVRLDAIPGSGRGGSGLLRALSTAARLGASSVELCAREIVRPSELSDTGLRQLRKMLNDSDLRVAAVRFQTRRGYDTLDQLERRVDATKQAMRMAYRIGCPVVINQIGKVPDPSLIRNAPAAGVEAFTSTSGPDAAGSPDAVGAFVSAAHQAEIRRWQTLRSVLDDLGRFGQHVGAILVAETGTEPGPWLAELLDATDDAFIGVALNPGQMIVNRFDVRPAVQALRERIRVVSAVDGVIDLAAGRGLSVPLGRGTADFPEIIGLLEDAQYRGPYVVGRPAASTGSADRQADQRAVQELQDAVDYLRNL